MSLSSSSKEDLEKLKDISPKYHEKLSNVEDLLIKNVSVINDLKEKLEKSIKQKKGQEEEEEEDMIPQILEVNKNLNDILRTFRDINKDSEK
jgi:hypothetical protein